MQKKIVFILILMSCCVITITGLQLYWNYQSYKSTINNFSKDSNNALNITVDKEIKIRQQLLISKVKNWLADTSFINIECNIENRDSSTVFTIQDVHPRYEEDKNRKAKSYSFGIGYFKKKLKKITPEAKRLFINHFAERTFKSDLENGVIYYYTQGLGDSISKVFDESRVNAKLLSVIYKQELAKREINSPFKLNSSTKNTNQFITNKFNTALRKPFEKEMVWATLENPNTYYLREMKWLIITSFLLIAITVCCFFYTIKTLFGQHKLVSIKNQFISNMTHEIHTPLSSIQITAEALQKFKFDEETRDKYLDIILYQTKKLNGLSEEILANAKLETLDFVMDQTIDLNQLILNIVENHLSTQNIKIEYMPTDSLIIKGNKAHLSRSIENVLENAIKYNSSANPIIELNLTKTQKGVKLTIEDDGPGIADEFKQRIFEQFYRIPTGNVHDIKGYGLGLSYVKKVILQHKGSIMVLDNYPSGCIFSINLPL